MKGRKKNRKRKRNESESMMKMKEGWRRRNKCKGGGKKRKIFN